jgi:signal transduction histidine kinase
LLGALVGLACCRYVVPAALAGTRWFALQTRLVTTYWCGVVIPAAYRTRPERLGYRQRMEGLLSDPGTWRDLLWLTVSLVAAPVLLLGPIALAVAGAVWSLSIGLNGFDRSLGGLGVAVGLASVPWTLRAYGRLAALVLAPSGNAELEHRVAYLAQTRQESLDSGAAELRRIERDLHDGAQQRLVALAMELGRAKAKLADDDAAAALVDQAHTHAKAALAELRDLVRGVHPPVLTDRGLDAALSGLAARCPVPVDLQVDVPVRPRPAVEAVAYFTVAEALTNVAKHSRATHVRVIVDGGPAPAGTLNLVISDDGIGGADPSSAGLRGLADRIEGIDGALSVESPPGGPTIISAVIPCA